jgi:ketosteroid isomerase-like protein
MKGFFLMHPCKNIVPTALMLVLFGLTLAQAKNASDEQVIRDIDTSWSKAAGAKDLDKVLAVYADDASLLPPNAPIATGTAAIRSVWSQLMASPGYSLSFAPNKVVISKSGDVAYEIGTFQLTLDDALGKPETSVGKFVVVWEKRGGQWRAVADIFNDDK